MKIRYDFKDENGETRRERNARFNVESPDLVIPGSGRYLWDWFESLASGVGRVSDGVCAPIPWTEFLAWANVTGNVVFPSEYVILRAMDATFCEETNKEFENYRARLAEKHKVK